MGAVQEREMSNEEEPRTEEKVPHTTADRERNQPARGDRQNPYREAEDTPTSPGKVNLCHPDMFQRRPVANTGNDTHDWKWVGETVETQGIGENRSLFHFSGDWEAGLIAGPEARPVMTAAQQPFSKEAARQAVIEGVL